MPETIETKIIDLDALKETIPHGGQRELAKRMKCLPDKISKALDGFVRDGEFMGRLQSEAHQLIKEFETGEWPVKCENNTIS